MGTSSARIIEVSSDCIFSIFLSFTIALWG
nr:MAG TPA: hypothetical protein [Caudoviricetes sp.]